MDKELESGDFIGHFECVANEFENKEGCTSSDGLAVYEKINEEGETVYDGFCWSCNQHFSVSEILESSLAEELGAENGKVVKKKFKKKPKKEAMTKDEVVAFIKEIGYNSGNYRGIQDKYSQFYGHLTELDKKGNVIARYYPETEDGKVVGYKSRIPPKKFGYKNRGRTGVNSELSGQIKFTSGGKYLLIVGGEEDKAAAFEMLREAQIKRGQKEYEPIAVVSPTTGEGSAYKQVAKQYDFCDQFDWIIIGMDNDEKGKESAEKVAEVLPQEKVKIATWSRKDPNTMLNESKQAQFLRDFYNAKEYVNTGVKSSAEIIDDVKDVLVSDKITLPNYMHRAETMMKRAFSTNGRVVNILGSTSCGKSTHVNNMTYHWIFEEGLKPLIISLEMTAGEYAVDLLSLHLKKNLDWFESGMDAWDYLEREDVKEMYKDLFTDAYGEERFRIVDDRDGKISTLTKQIERGVKQYGCNIVIIDVLTDLLRFLPMDEQEKHMAWQKNFVKSGVSIVNVLHTRKPERDKNGKLRKTTEYDVLGSGTFVQSAHINLIINRDKMANDEIEKNSTYVDMPKCRRGRTGEAGVWYYEPTTRQVYDREDYLQGKVGNDVEYGIEDELPQDAPEPEVNF